METWKRGLLFGGAGILGGLILSALIADEDEDEDEDEDAGKTLEPVDKDGLEALLDRVREDARTAMDSAQTDEERATVFASVEEKIGALQKAFDEGGTQIADELKKQMAVSDADVREERAAKLAHIEETTETVREALGEILRRIRAENVSTASGI